MRLWFALLLLSSLVSCKEHAHGLSDNVDSITPDWDMLAILYYEADSLVRSHDTTYLYNSKLDTILIETGIFSKLRYDYPMCAPWEPAMDTKAAIKYEADGEILNAKEHYMKVIEYHEIEMPLVAYSCANDYHTSHIHTAMLASYAYEKIGQPDSAINVLKPWLANHDVNDADIQVRFIELCINRYGLATVKSNFENAATTLQKKIIHVNPRNLMWTVSIFGAPIMVGNGEEFLSSEDAMYDLMTKPFCYLID